MTEGRLAGPYLVGVGAPSADQAMTSALVALANVALGVTPVSVVQKSKHLPFALAGCHRATVDQASGHAALDLNAELVRAKAGLTGLLPVDMHVSRAEVPEPTEGRGS